MNGYSERINVFDPKEKLDLFSIMTWPEQNGARNSKISAEPCEEMISLSQKHFTRFDTVSHTFKCLCLLLTLTHGRFLNDHLS